MTDFNSVRSNAIDMTTVGPARTHGPYRLVQLLGEGLIAQVFEAVDPVSRRTVAIKLIRPGILQSPQLSARLRAHAVGPPRLEHANVNPLLSMICDGDEIGIVYPVVHGYALDREVQRAGPARLPRMIPQFVKILEAFEAAHSRRCFHLDIKPGNLVFPADAPAQVLDFSMSRMLGISSLTADLLGSLDYMSPEQLAGEEMDGRADIFSLGAALYHLTTGGLPFTMGADRAATLASRWIAPRPPGLVIPSMPTRLEEIILKALAHAPRDRFQTVTAFKLALSNCSLGSSAAVQVAVPRPMPNPEAAPKVTPVQSRPKVVEMRKPFLLPAAPPPPARSSGLAGWVALAIAIAAGSAATWTASRGRSDRPAPIEAVVSEPPKPSPVEAAAPDPPLKVLDEPPPAILPKTKPTIAKSRPVFISPPVHVEPQSSLEIAAVPLPSSLEPPSIPQASQAIPLWVPQIAPPPPGSAAKLSPVRVTSTDQEARRLGGRSPAYPTLARFQGITGTVRVRITVSPEGRVLAIVPLSGHVLLKQAATAAIKTWTYSPTIIEGRAVPVVADVSVVFNGK